MSISVSAPAVRKMTRGRKTTPKKKAVHTNQNPKISRSSARVEGENHEYRKTEQLWLFMRKANTMGMYPRQLPTYITESTLSVLLGVEEQFIIKIFANRGKLVEYQHPSIFGYNEFRTLFTTDRIQLSGWKFTQDWVDYIKEFEANTAMNDVANGYIRYGAYQGLPLPVALSNKDACLTITQIAFLLQTTNIDIYDIIDAINTLELESDLYVYDNYMIRVCRQEQIKNWLRRRKAIEDSYDLLDFNRMCDVFRLNNSTASTKYDPPKPNVVKNDIPVSPEACEYEAAKERFEAIWYNAQMEIGLKEHARHTFYNMPVRPKLSDADRKKKYETAMRKLHPCGEYELAMCARLEANLDIALLTCELNGDPDSPIEVLEYW